MASKDDDVTVSDEDDDVNELPQTWPDESTLSSDRVHFIQDHDEKAVHRYKKNIYTCRKKGNVLVINNERFPPPHQRKGSDKDIHKITTVFSQLGFRVIVHHNLTKDKNGKILDYHALTERKLQLDELSVRTRALHESTVQQDKGTEALHELIRTIKLIQDQIKKEIKHVQKKEKEMDKNRKLDEEKEGIHKMEMQKLKNEADLTIKEEQIALEKANKENEEEMKIREEVQQRREEKWEKEQEEAKIKIEQEQREEKERHHREMDDLIRDYKSVKNKSDDSFLGSLKGAIKWSTVKIDKTLVKVLRFVVADLLNDN